MPGVRRHAQQRDARRSFRPRQRSTDSMAADSGGSEAELLHAGLDSGELHAEGSRGGAVRE